MKLSRLGELLVKEGLKQVEVLANHLASEMRTNLVKAYNPNRIQSGRLYSSIHATRVNEDTWFIGTTTPYADFVNRGTGLYAGDNPPIPVNRVFVKRWITPKRAKRLVFEVQEVEQKEGLKKLKGKRLVFAKRVKGQKPKWFVEHTIEHAKPKVVATIRNILSNVLNQLK